MQHARGIQLRILTGAQVLSQPETRSRMPTMTLSETAYSGSTLKRRVGCDMRKASCGTEMK